MLTLEEARAQWKAVEIDPELVRQCETLIVRAVEDAMKLNLQWAFLESPANIFGGPVFGQALRQVTDRLQELGWRVCVHCRGQLGLEWANPGISELENELNRTLFNRMTENPLDA